MRILLCHNYYQQPGGEDQVFHDEARLLESHGHEVVRFTRHNDAIREMPGWKAAVHTIWNRETVSHLRQTIRSERPVIVHFTNTFPLISPAAYYAARSEGVKIVQSLHNFRLICPGALLLRDGHVCEECLGKRIPWPAVTHGCYRGDRKATAVVASMLAFHRAIGTWTRVVDQFYALTEFGRRKFIEGGLPAAKIAVKPNFMAVDPGAGDGIGGYALFVGRLSPEKGFDTLLAAWETAEIDLPPLLIVGDGPCRDRVRRAAEGNPRVEWLGHQPHNRILEMMGRACLLVLPSLNYEGFPKTIVEAFAKGTPIVASNLGAMAQLIDDERTGILVAPGDPKALATATARLVGDSRSLRKMRVNARFEFEAKYTAAANYRMLLTLYGRALGRPIGDGEGADPSSQSVGAAAEFAVAP
jgi:glycosyltransferase involved in cell wall biosynthesis